MTSKRQVVITGVGVVSPIGIGKDPFWSSLAQQQSGVRRLDLFVAAGRPAPIGGVVSDFDPKRYVRPRKSLKVMSRDIQLAFAAADLAYSDAGLPQHPHDPERTGIAMGADMIACELEELAPVYRDCLVDGQFCYDRWGKAIAGMYPLWMLKYLPNMPACHIGIAQDVRGPTNAIVLGEVSSLSAVVEAVRAIERGQVDVMVAGGAGSRVHPMIWGHEQARQYTQRGDDPAAACRPFDSQRDGMINGEGAGAFVLETRENAEARGAKILAQVLGFAATFEPLPGKKTFTGKAIRSAIRGSLANAGLAAADVGHVNAHGLSTTNDDPIEAQAIADTLGDVPVTAPKSYFGNLGAGSGAVEMAASVLGLEKGIVPSTLNYQTPDPRCPVNVCRQPMPVSKSTAVVLSHSWSGQAVSVVIGR
jgi:3-oxoacyl-[acyl-carrier-protein] synthase II